MSRERWPSIKALFAKALQSSTARRQELLAEAGDSWLREEVASLLAADAQAGDFLERPTAPAQELSRIGAYRLIKPLGRGGMGLVHLAVRDDGSFQKRVALKVLHGTPDAALRQRFRSERQILAALDHPGVVRLLDGGQGEDGSPYLVMEYVEGLPIDTYCRRHELPLNERLRVFLAVCAAVHCTHQNLVVHGDIKPGNILVTAEGAPKLLDFGAARFLNPELGAGALEPSEQRLRLFTPEFASPEQLRGEALGVTSDVYSLGLLLYVLLAGENPSANGAPRARSRMPEDLSSIVRFATHKDPRQRYASAAQLAADVQRYLERRPVQARPAALGYRTGRFMLRNGRSVAGIAVLAIGIAALLTALASSGRLRPARPTTATTATTDGAGQGDGAAPAANIRALLAQIEQLAKQGDKEAQMALPLLYFAQGHLLMRTGDAFGAMRSFRQGGAARRTAPHPPEMYHFLAQ